LQGETRSPQNQNESASRVMNCMKANVLRLAYFRQLSLNIARDLCQKRRPYEALPYLREAMKDSRNIDAGIELAFLAPTKQDSIEILEDAAERGKSQMDN
jgi:hypothetical protein